MVGFIMNHALVPGDSGGPAFYNGKMYGMHESVWPDNIDKTNEVWIDEQMIELNVSLCSNDACTTVAHP
jgi:hypothetical protein